MCTAAEGHTSSGWRSITITDTDTPTFSKSRKRTASLLSSLPSPPAVIARVHSSTLLSAPSFGSSNTLHTSCPSILRPNVQGTPAPSREGGLGMGSGSLLRWRRPGGPLSVVLVRLLGKRVEVWWQLQERAGCVLRALSSAGWGQQGEGLAPIGILKERFILFL